MGWASLSIQRSFLVAALGLVLSAMLSVGFSLGYTPTAGVLSGAFLGLANFASLYRFGIRVLHAAGQRPGDSRCDGTAPPSSRTRALSLSSFLLRFPMVVAGLAVVARYFGIAGLVSCTMMLFAVQVPLFVNLGQNVVRFRR